MNRKSKKYSLKNRWDFVIFTYGCKCVSMRACVGVRMIEWVIVAYQCVYVWVHLNESTNAARCFNRT